MPFHRTTDHPASSYGIPALVDEAGRAYGPDDLLSASQAADLMGLSLREVQRLCKEGILSALNVGGRYVIKVRDAESYTPRPAHRPKGSA